MFRNFKEKRLSPDCRSDLQTAYDDLVKIHHEDYSSDEDFVYADVNLHNVVGKQMVMWSYKMPDTLAIYTPLAGDNLSKLSEFAEANLQYDKDREKLMVLKPKRRRPVNVLDIYRIKHGSCITILPKTNPTITLEAKQLNAKYDLVLSPSTTIKELKKFLEREKGYPVNRIELLYKDVPLQNSKHLYDYSIGHKARIFVMLHLYHDLLVHVECFWGQTYHIYIDPCMTSDNIIHMILKRTVSPNIKNVTALFELYLPKHTVVLYHKKSHMKFYECIGKYNVKEDSTIKLTTLALHNKLALQKINVTLDNGLSKSFSVSQFDCWSTVALKIHDETRVPINIIRLYKGNREIDFSETIGPVFDGDFGPKISASLLQAQIDPDTLYGLELKIELGTGVTEVTRCSASRTIRTVKDRLLHMGVPNAHAYDLFANDKKLPSDGRIADVVDDPRLPISLQLRSYPVYIHTPKTVIYKMFAHAHESLATFKVRIQMKTGLSIKHYDLLLAGNIISASDDTSVFQTPIGIKMSVFLIPRERFLTFILLSKDWLIKIPIPTNPIYKQIKNALWKEPQIPEGCLYSISNFLLWSFQKTGSKHSHGKVRKIYDPLAIGGPQETVRLPEVQQDQMKELRHEKHNKSMVRLRGHNPKYTFPFKPGVITMETAVLLSQR